ncbi:MAG: peroxiredoxin-like family protein [Tannerella sp.]|uniref:peroxiredoxin-like family protein n=1 Tax=Tannerella sp. TaxID=2382127 RepID=UPI003FA27E05
MKNVLKSVIVLLAIFVVGTLQAQDASKALKQGDKVKDFTLKNAKGEEVNLSVLLKKGPVVLTWYRGGWCPYCNLALKQLQEELAQIKEQGAMLVALTPELPDHSLTTQEKNALEFEVLTDLHNEVARSYGLVFKLDPQTAERYESMLHLSAHNGTDSSELPIPATYVVDTDGTIRYAYVNPDYKQRADAKTVVEELKKLK